MTPHTHDTGDSRATAKRDVALPRIRTATRADVPAIAALIRDLAAHDGAQVPQEAALHDVLDTLMQTGSTVYVVAESTEAHLAGILQVSIRLSTWDAAPYAYLEDFFVEERFRRRGTGSALLAQAVEIARERGCVRIDLDVLAASDAARAFYARRGFVDQQRLYLRLAL